MMPLTVTEIVKSPAVSGAVHTALDPVVFNDPAEACQEYVSRSPAGLAIWTAMRLVPPGAVIVGSAVSPWSVRGPKLTGGELATAPPVAGEAAPPPLCAAPAEPAWDCAEGALPDEPVGSGLVPAPAVLGWAAPGCVERAEPARAGEPAATLSRMVICCDRLGAT
ncbi:MAG TPA: hypothetical protein VFU40_07850, partial [Gemmatimonadales bacterium]|nr:hypothetical protein [Gemmatimonadales bacterium]